MGAQSVWTFRAFQQRNDSRGKLRRCSVGHPDWRRAGLPARRTGDTNWRQRDIPIL